MVVSLVTAFVGLFIVLAFAVAAVVLRAIDGRGFLASVAVGYSIIFGGGLSWFVIVAVFFTLGVLFTLYQYGYKKRLGGAQEKGGARNWPNVLANGGLPSIFAIGELLQPGPAFTALFLGSVSSAAADTVATELGLLSNGRPRLITSPTKVVAPGTSGGVTPLGFLGAGMAALSIGAMALFLGLLDSPSVVLPLCVLGGVLGAAADSLIGASLQRKGYCSVCLRPTEALRHCGEITRLTDGVPFIENNVVNLLAGAVGGAGALAFLSVFG